VIGTGEVVRVPVGRLLGRIVDPLGRPLDRDSQTAETQMPSSARTAIIKAPVSEPLQTGIWSSTLFAVGRGGAS
jgi:F-type H+-transporting ATPase subunit alpha